MATLTLCPACRRHARAHEPRCPFCGASLERTTSAREAAPSSAVASRSQQYALGAVLAAGVAGCSGAHHGGGRGGGGGDDEYSQPRHHGGGPCMMVYETPPPDPREPAPEDAGADNEQTATVRYRRPVGHLSCPPYGCVFPDEAGAVVRA